MTYGEIDIETARKICKKVNKNCTKCPLRRERTTKYQTLRTLFCNYELRKLFEKNYTNEKEKEFSEEQLKILLNENIKYEEELRKMLKTL